jgi:hypothetical protein
MWFYPLLIVLVVLAIGGGTVAGGVYTLVLIPLAVVAVVSAVVYAMWGRAMQGQAGGSTEATAAKTEPLPHHRTRPSGRAATSPEALADARRQQQ